MTSKNPSQAFFALKSKPDTVIMVSLSETIEKIYNQLDPGTEHKKFIVNYPDEQQVILNEGEMLPKSPELFMVYRIEPYKPIVYFYLHNNPSEIKVLPEKTTINQFVQSFNHKENYYGCFYISSPNNKSYLCQGSYIPVGHDHCSVNKIHHIPYQELMEFIPGFQREKADALRPFYDNRFSLDQPCISKFINGYSSGPLTSRIIVAMDGYFKIRS